MKKVFLINEYGKEVKGQTGQRYVVKDHLIIVTRYIQDVLPKMPRQVHYINTILNAQNYFS